MMHCTTKRAVFPGPLTRLPAGVVVPADRCCATVRRAIARNLAVRYKTKEEDTEGQLDSNQKRHMEDELRDPKNFLEYFLPRPLRLVLFGGSALSCFVGALITAAKLIQEPALQEAEGTGPQNLVINVIGMLLFAGLFFNEQSAADRRIEQRRELRRAQIRQGDREVYLNKQGETMSKLKEVDDDWIIRRLERWAKRDQMPFIGPKKGAILQHLVQQQPKLAVEVGTMAGYSAIVIAQALPPTSRLISVEKDLTWWLVAKRFIGQASQGEKNKQRQTPLDKMVDVWWGDACQKLPSVTGTPKGQLIDFLFIDGTPKEALSYLQAAEPYLAEGAMVVADNAGVFAEGGMKGYLEFVRGNPNYSSRYIESTLEWRDDVPDGIEVSVYKPSSSHQQGTFNTSSKDASVATSSL